MSGGCQMEMAMIDVIPRYAVAADCGREDCEMFPIFPRKIEPEKDCGKHR